MNITVGQGAETVLLRAEYLSRVLSPSKPYLGFVAASAGCLEEIMARGTMVNGVGKVDI